MVGHVVADYPLPLMWELHEEMGSPVGISSASQKATFGRTWIKKNISTEASGPTSHIWMPSRELMPMYKKTPYKTCECDRQNPTNCFFKYRHGNLGKDGRHEGWEANQDENHNMGHPGSAQVVVFSCYFWWTQINPNELTQKARV